MTRAFTIPRRLGQIRKDRGLLQQQVAAALGVSVRAVSFWENENSSPSVGHTIAYAALVDQRLIARRGEQILDVPTILGDLGAFRRLCSLSQPVLDWRNRGLTRASILESRIRRGIPVRLATAEGYLSGLGYALDLAAVKQVAA